MVDISSSLLVSIEVPGRVWCLSTMRELEKGVGGWSTTIPLLQVGYRSITNTVSQLALVVCSKTISACVSHHACLRG